ncbi:MAG: hypothetical protein HY975_01805, partial [Candidatus Kerfeldbacteria bacterium]|nr:hypothetical protein [Candidatus Kerfeldbacteria bacterium]
NGVTPSVGYFGSISKAKYVALTGGTTSTTSTTLPAGCTSTAGYSSTTGAKCDGGTTVAVASGLTVVAGTQPANSLAVMSATRLPFTVVKFTASADKDVTIDSLTVERTGLANDAAFAGVVLTDENGNQLGVAKTLNSLHQAVLTEDFVVKAGQTRTMTIGANRITTATTVYSGQVASFSLVSVAANATVNGTLPIVGASHTINESLTMGTVTMTRGSIDPGTGVTKEVGSTGYTFSAVKVTAGSGEDVILKSIRWNQTGSAGSGDFANLKIYVDGVAYDVVVSADGKYYSAVFGSGLTIAKGFSSEISIKGDIVGGSGRTIDFDIAKRTDVNVVGAMYGYGITPPTTGSGSVTVTATSASSFTNSEDPWFAAARVTLSAGTMTVSTSNTVAAQIIAVILGVQPLAAFTADVKGEAISVSKIAFNVTIGNLTASSETVADITNATLYDENGKVVAGPVDGTATEGNSGGATGTSHGEIIFSDSVTFPTGLHTYTLNGKIGTNFDTNDTITASTTPRNFTSATGQTTNTSINIDPNSVLTFPAMTVKAGALTISVSTVPIAQTVIANQSQFTFANYILDATASGEDVRLTSIPLEYNSASPTNLTNCKLYDGSTAVTTGSNTKSPSAAASSSNFTFDGNGLTVSKGTSKTIALKCDVSGSVSANTVFYWGINSTSANSTNMTSVSGLTSGQTIAQSVNGAIGQAMTAQTGGSMTAQLETGVPYALVNSGSTGVTLAKIRFTATNEDVDLKQIALKLSGVASNTPIDLVDRKVSLYADSTYIGSATFPTADNATSSAITSGTFRIPANSYKILTIKGDIAAISSGSGPLTASGDLLAVDYDGANNGLNGNYGTGVSSGTTVTPTSASTASNGVRIVKSYPTFALPTKSNNCTLTTCTLPSSDTVGMEMYRFSITASSNGPVGIYKLVLNVATSSASAVTGTTTMTNLKVIGYTDSGYTTKVDGYTDGLLKSLATINSGDNDVVLLSVLNIPASATRYFKVTGDLDMTQGSGTYAGSVTTKLGGDAAYPVNAITLMDQATGTDGDTNDNFIWSPVSTNTSALAASTDLDWTNGYYVSGLPTDYLEASIVSR